MASLKTDLDLRHFQALLNGVVKKNIYRDKMVTLELLLHEIYKISATESSSPNILRQIEAYEALVKTAAFEHWTPGTLESFLLQSDLSPEHIELFTKFWRKEWDKINYSIIKESSWNDSLQDMRWRVDMIVGSKDTIEIQEPGVILELKLDKRTHEETIRFEMDRNKLQNVLENINEIEQVIQNIL